MTLVAIPAIHAQSLIGSEFFAERNDHNPSAMFALCHQIPQRSFLWLWDPPWLCARCTGFYFAIVVALLLFALRPRWGNTWAFRVAAAGVLAAGAIGLEKFLALELGNWGRCLIALPVGFAVGLGLVLPFISRRYQGVSQ